MNANSSDVMRPPGRVESLHGRMADLLHALDEAQLHGPAAYVAMALDTIVRDHPELNASR